MGAITMKPIDNWRGENCALTTDEMYHTLVGESAHRCSILICSRCTIDCKFKIHQPLPDYIQDLLKVQSIDEKMVNIPTTLGDEFPDID